jgi:type II restriction enzyme
MKLDMVVAVAAGFKSGSQIARRVTEAWGAANIYCAACPTETVEATPPNAKAIDFRCASCGAGYQLKAGRGWSEVRVPDAAYATMIATIRANATPNLLVMQYTPNWTVRNLLLVPAFFLTESAIERRPPLAPTARRAGWIGCNILLRAIAPDGKLRLVQESTPAPASLVRRQYQRVCKLARLPPNLRGWTLDVFRAVRNLNQRSFTLADVYRAENELASLHPQNQNVRPKIRQHLQVLRDLGLVRFHGRGSYSLTG